MADESMGTSYIRVLPDMSGLNAQLVGYFNGPRFSKLGKVAGVGLAAGLAAAGVGKVLYDIGAEFDDAFDKIRTGTGATGKELEKLKGNLKNVVGTVPADIGSVGDAITELNKRLDLSGKPLERMSKQMLQLSKVTDTDLKGNIESVSKAFQDWDVNVKAQRKTLDGFFRVSQESGAGVAELAQQVQQFGSPLRQLGFDLDEAVSMFATFEEAGVNTSTMVPGLKLAISNLTRPTETLAGTMKDLGIAVGDPEKALQQIFDLLGDGSKLSDIDKTGLAMDTFGKRAGADMAEAIRQGRFEVDDLLKTFKSGDETIAKSERQTRDFSEQWQMFVLTLKKEVEPVATEVFGAVGKLMKDVRKAFKEGGIDQVLDLLLDKLEEAVPKVAELGGKIGLKLAGALGKAFLDAPILGKLFLGGVFLKAIGGFGAITSLGGSMGTKGGTSFGKNFARSAGPLIAALLAAEYGDDIGRALSDAIHGNPEDIEKAAKAAADAAQAVIFQTRLLADDYDSLKQRKADVKALAQVTGESVKEIRKEWGGLDRDMWKLGGANRDWDLTSNLEGVSKSAERTERRFDKSAEGIGSSLRSSGRDFSYWREDVGRHTEDVEGDGTKLERKLRASFRGVALGAGSLANAVGKALGNVGDNTNELLRDLKVGNVSFGIKKAGDILGDLKGAQAGGIASGYSKVDDRLIAIRGGEAILRPEDHVPTVDASLRMTHGIGLADYLKRTGAKVGGFAKGGIAGGLNFALGPYDIPPIAYDADHAGGNSHIHVTGSSVPWTVAMGKKFQSAGWMVGEHPAFGGVQGSHSATGGHYDALAFDANKDIVETRAQVEEAARLLGGAALGGAVKKVVRYLLTGPDGPWKRGGQSALDTTADAADKFLRDKMGSLGAGGTSISADGDVERVFAQVAKKLSTSKTATLALGMAGYAESGMRDLSYGDDSSQGALQLLASTARSYGIDPHDEGAIASGFFTHGYTGSGGANQHAAAGNPAHMVAQLVQGSSFSSGSNYADQAGLAKAWMQRFGLRDGGIVPGFASGGFAGLDKALNVIGHTKKPRKRRKAIKGLLESIRDRAVNPKLSERIKDLSGVADQSSEFGNLAGQLTADAPTGPDGKPLMENGKVVEFIEGLFRGKSESAWLTDELEARFKLRNVLVKAAQAVAPLITKTEKMRKAAQKEIADLKKAIREDEKRQRGFERDLQRTEKELEREGGKSGKNRNGAKIQQLRERAEALRGKLRFTSARLREKGRRLNVLDGRILPATDTQIGRLQSQQETFISDLITVQGSKEPFKRLTALPPLGEIGGDIFDVRLRLDELGKRVRLTDPDTGSDPPADAGGLSFSQLKEIAQATNYGVFDRLPKMHDGGWVVPPAGRQEMDATLKRGEYVLAPDVAAAAARGAVGGDDGEWAITIDNWEEGTGRIRRIADGQIATSNRDSNLAARAGVRR